MPKTLPPHVIARPDHSGQKMLDLMDAGHRLCFNDKLKRWEVWQFIWDSLGMRYEFVTRLLADDRKGGYADPGQWMIQRLRARDSRYAGADEAWKNVKAELDASEALATAAKEQVWEDKLSNLNEDVAKSHRLEWQLQADPHWTGRRHTEWDTEAVPFYFSSTTGREAIRDLGRTE